MQSRRHWLETAATACLGLSLSRCATVGGGEDTTLLPVPDFSSGEVLGYVGGVRPYRDGGFRLALDASGVAGAAGTKPVVHSYGYGGCGFTLSWGAAELAADLVDQAAVGARSGQPRTVAVLGAGAVGLATARVLQDRGYGVTIYARELSPNTVSDVAGAQWCPSLIAMPDDPAEVRRFERMLALSYKAFTSLDGERYGVVRRDNFVPVDQTHSFARIPAGLLPPTKVYDRLPFRGVVRPGFAYPTLLIEPPRYLPRVTQDVRDRGGGVVERRFAEAGELAQLPEAVIVNCTGIGAKALFGDEAMVPMRGQLAHLRPQALPYLLSHELGYIFPRSDCVVLGGTFEKGVATGVPEAATGAQIVRDNRAFFRPEPGRLARRDVFTEIGLRRF